MSEVASKESIEAAKGYESLLVPSLFHQWTDWVLDAAAVEKGSRVIDVACGTGVLARRASERVGPSGQVVGVDPAPGMLFVARELQSAVDWKDGAAESLPLKTGAFEIETVIFADGFESGDTSGWSE